MLFVFWAHLVPALVAGLLVNVLLHRLARRLVGPRLSHRSAKLVAAGLAGLVAVGIATAAILGVVALVRGHVGQMPEMLSRMADVLDETRLWLERHGGAALVPEALRDAEQVKDTAAEWLRAHSGTLRRHGGELGRALLHAALGMAVGVLVFFRHPTDGPGPLARALAERLRRIEEAFAAVVFAQVKISAVNTALTAAYLLAGLPLFGVHLPFGGTLVAVTFLTGLLPVVGNLVSNTIIVVISLGVSPWVALASLAFLVAIHKLEYFVNARIVGGEIHAAAWEILVSMIAFETAFGVPGLVMAPILYAYVKRELVDRGLV
jgi:predicted PurR-regulated permease PerM